MVERRRGLDLREVGDWVRDQVSPGRFRHIQGVVRAAKALAKREGLSVQDAETAAWLHDCAKELPKARMLSALRGTPFRLDPQERSMPGLWHPHAGAALALRKWGVRKPAILEAIRRHTLGSADMGPLAQALFVADFIEPGRDFPGVTLARRAASKGLRQGVLMKASMTLDLLLRSGRIVHPRLVETWNSFLEEKT
jgi:predicted HD superfamily hydrolase involved in NAD metabolism